MSARFADAAMRCAGLAAHVLAWRPAEFWNATPAELAMALSVPDEISTAPLPPPSRAAIARMMERDAND